MEFHGSPRAFRKNHFGAIEATTDAGKLLGTEAMPVLRQGLLCRGQSSQRYVGDLLVVARLYYERAISRV
jgi:hypothetical protein